MRSTASRRTRSRTLTQSRPEHPETRIIASSARRNRPTAGAGRVGGRTRARWASADRTGAWHDCFKRTPARVGAGGRTRIGGVNRSGLRLWGAHRPRQKQPAPSAIRHVWPHGAPIPEFGAQRKSCLGSRRRRVDPQPSLAALCPIVLDAVRHLQSQTAFNRRLNDRRSQNMMRGLFESEFFSQL